VPRESSDGLLASRPTEHFIYEVPLLIKVLIIVSLRFAIDTRWNTERVFDGT
jgi:hypothetical protein